MDKEPVLKNETFLLDLTGDVVKDIDGGDVKIGFNVSKDVANLVYRSITEVDYLQPLQELSKEGKAIFTVSQLDNIERLVKDNYVLMLKLSICERIKQAREAVRKEDE